MHHSTPRSSFHRRLTGEVTREIQRATEETGFTGGTEKRRRTEGRFDWSARNARRPPRCERGADTSRCRRLCGLYLRPSHIAAGRLRRPIETPSPLRDLRAFVISWLKKLRSSSFLRSSCETASSVTSVTSVPKSQTRKRHERIKGLRDLRSLRALRGSDRELEVESC